MIYKSWSYIILDFLFNKKQNKLNSNVIFPDNQPFKVYRPLYFLADKGFFSFKFFYVYFKGILE